MAVYQRILFEKSRRTSLCNFNKEKSDFASSLESTASEGSKIKEFYESVIASETTKPDIYVVSDNVCSSDVKPSSLKRDKAKRKRLTKRRMVNVLLKAATEGDLKAAKELVEDNSEIVNMRDDFGWTALMCACCSTQVEMVVYLLNEGAKWIGIKDKAGKDAMRLAQQTGQLQIVDLLENNGSYSTESNKDNELTTKAFYCNSCKTNIKASSSKEHKSSTVHQFCMQHSKPSTMYYLNDNNKGYQMMLKDGWDSQKGLGPDGSGMKFPVKTTLKRDRKCLGSKSEDCRPRVTHFKPFDTAAVKNERKVKKKDEFPHKQKKQYSMKQHNKSRKWEIEYRHSWTN